MRDDVNEKLLDTDIPKYELAKLAALHFQTIKNKQEHASTTVPGIIVKSLDDILSGKVSAKDIYEAHTQKQQETLSSEEKQKLKKK